MRLIILLTIFLTAAVVTAQEGPADRLWELYKKGRFEDVVREGKVELTTGTSTAQVNLAVGRALVDLKRFEEGLVYLQTAARVDSDQTWVYAWAQNYLGSSYFALGRRDEARAAWILARDCRATANATKNAEGNLKGLGLTEFYDDWKAFTSEHFVFHYSPKLKGFDAAAFARRHEKAYGVITAWFGGGPTEPIEFFVWSGNDEAAVIGMPQLGFSRPSINLIHSRVNQTVGHEMTHVISWHAVEPVLIQGLINEGIAVYHDQTQRNWLAESRKVLADKEVKVSLAALWEDWSLQPEEVSYGIGGAWVNYLLVRGGKEKFLEFFHDQSLANARQVYGGDLQDWMDDFDAELYR